MREINKMKKFSIVFAIMLLGIFSLSADKLTSYTAERLNKIFLHFVYFHGIIACVVIKRDVPLLYA